MNESSLFRIGNLTIPSKKNYFLVRLRGGSDYEYYSVELEFTLQSQFEAMLKCIDWYFSQPLNRRRIGGAHLVDAPYIDEAFQSSGNFIKLWEYDALGNPYELISYSTYYFDEKGDKYELVRTGTRVDTGENHIPGTQMDETESDIPPSNG